MRFLLVSLGFLGLMGAATQLTAQEITAILEPAELIDIRPSVSGQVLSLETAEGDRVEAGDILARIDARDQEGRVRLAEALASAAGQLQRAEAQVVQAETLVERMRKARASGAAQQWELEQAEQVLALAEADLQIARDGQTQAQAQLAIETALLERYTLRAPFAGAVLEISTSVGSQLDTTSPVLSLADLMALESTAFVPLDWASSLSPKNRLSGLIDGSDVVSAEAE